ncbi:glycosyltransferase family protein [Jannaschia rubra]|uniref:Undecaprenyldiphospho-muramoylpentapeptide beta-N-acetylglucosaminyltransferase n=1 Tax=Jannaschia rubra TaxID=282197 RepID=A0A0M6XLT5_9RHOB|nr:glycosyltransferase [Jannaschia rubra]CTQ31888.1 undecaprenyldiphospho-muramoylpentapeptide beta-N-acetylglucosaminyltransferase [Jannaschia rubra]SFG78114.1 Predicted glycosyl transferase [Jannaschia rubra]
MFHAANSTRSMALGRTAPRIVLYSHDTLGFGHLRRNLLIAAALRQMEPAPQVLMITGMREAGAFELPPGVDCISLPAYAKGVDGTYRPRDLGGDLAALAALRARTIEAAVLAFDPDLMIVDNVPRGAQQELDPTLAALRRRGRTRVVLGLRDVIDTPDAVHRQWAQQRNFEAVSRWFDAVWVYGDPTFYDLLADCGFDAVMGDRSRFTGYLDHSGRLAAPLAIRERDRILAGDPRPYVLCTVGGGRDGAEVSEAFLRAPMPAGHRGILITGSQMPGGLREEMRGHAAGRDDMTVVDFVSEPLALMAGAARIVAMGGYNTVCEVLSLGRPALIVPRAVPRAEQVLRAERLAARGLINMMLPDDLTPDALGDWLGRAVSEPLAGAIALDMSGLDRVRDFTARMLTAPHDLRVAS